MAIAAAVVVLLVAVNAFYVAAEFSAVASRRSRLSRLAAEGQRGAQAVLPLIESRHRLNELVAASQVGITAASLALGAYGQAAIAQPRLSPWLARQAWVAGGAALPIAVAVVLVALTAAQVVFGELLPKAIALRHPEAVLMALSGPTRASMRLLAPAVRVLNGSSIAVLGRLGVGAAAPHAHLHSPAEIEVLVTESGDAGALDRIERAMLESTFALDELVARQVMIPRSRLDLAAIDTPIDELLARLARSRFSRIPVYQGSPDAVVGIVHIKDLFRLKIQGRSDVAEAVRPVPFVPDTLPVSRLWHNLLPSGNPVAVVLDEYGGTAGLVSQDALVSEVLGEIPNEFDPRPDPIVKPRRGQPLVRGDLLVDEVNDALGTALPEDRADTIGGLVLDLLGRMPRVGDEVECGEAVLRVYAVRGNSVARVRVARLEEREDGATDD
ncbi:MAG: hemolysin family protein [Anaerolineae bacterium]